MGGGGGGGGGLFSFLGGGRRIGSFFLLLPQLLADLRTRFQISTPRFLHLFPLFLSFFSLVAIGLYWFVCVCVCVCVGVIRHTPKTYIYMKGGMVSRAFIIIRNYNSSLIICVVKQTGEDKGSNPLFCPVFPYRTVHLQMCSTFPSNTTLCLTNSKIVYCLVRLFLFASLLVIFLFVCCCCRFSFFPGLFRLFFVCSSSPPPPFFFFFFLGGERGKRLVVLFLFFSLGCMQT